MESVLDVLDGLADIRSRLVWEHVSAVSRLHVVESLKSLESGCVQRQRQRPSALRPRNSKHTIRQVNLIPLQLEQAATPKTRVSGQNNLLFEVRRSLNRPCRLE